MLRGVSRWRRSRAAFLKEARMDIKQLQCFVVVAQHGSLGKAASKLRLSPSTISGYIGQLEAELGTELFIRFPRGVKLTSAGQELARGARGVLLAVEQVRHDVTAAGTEVAGRVRVCLPTSPATILSVPLLEHLQRHHPRVHLELFAGYSGFLQEMLNQNRYDIGLLYTATPLKGLVVEPLLDEDLVLVGGFDPGERSDVALAETAKLRFVFPSANHLLRQTIDRAFDSLSLQPDVIADLDSLQAIKDMTFKGTAATILSISGTGYTAGHPYDVSIRRIINPTITRTVALCRPITSSEAPAVTITAGILAQLTSQMVVDGTWAGARLRS